MSVSSAHFKPGHPITDVTINYGPPTVLGRFFLEANAACEAVGIKLTFGTFEELLAANTLNRASWKPITSMYDHRLSGQNLTPDKAFCIFGRNAAGEIVATQAARLFTLTSTSLYDEFTSLRAFYDRPESSAQPGETCTVTAETTKATNGRVLVGGAAWYRPDYRGIELSAWLPRISRALAYTRWSTDVTTSIMVEGIVKGGVMARSGYRNIEWAVDIKNSTVGDVRCAFVWMDPERLIDDLREMLAAPGAEVDTSILQRRA
ncbi:MAG: hypothetical protein ABL898_01465 [Hyphomicrobiaceae bacterium]|nr:hypothetical protein [Hyphomicrobiaceae bacterium]